LSLGDGLRTAVEVIVLAGAIYAFIRFLQETRGSGVLKGLVLVVAIGVVGFAVLVQFAQLERLKWLAERGLAGLIFALVVVFQPEIRQALVSLGDSALLRGFTRRQRATLADEIAEAAFALAMRGMGALILIERGDGLAGFTEGAVKIDAVLSSPLLVTLFQKDTPLHDGAVLVRGDRVVAAGCLLPLSDNPNLAQTLGTRHRAALGATEESDAVAVVVSEETRRVSIAVRGALEADVTPERLRAALEASPGDEPADAPGRREVAA